LIKHLSMKMNFNEINGRVQEWTDLPEVGDPEIQLRPVAPQASAVQSRAASSQT
jgi:hypothetical protein